MTTQRRKFHGTKLAQSGTKTIRSNPGLFTSGSGAYFARSRYERQARSFTCPASSAAYLLPRQSQEALMPCNGWRHPATCECGWGGMWHGNVPISHIGSDGNTRLDANESPVEAPSVDRLVVNRKPESLTIPNARCPVCGASVFFYQNEYGSRIFFDSLGYDWPKHPCTDNSHYDSPASGKIFAPKSVVERRARWLGKGWRPFLIYQKREDHVILAGYQADEYLRLDLKFDFLSNVFPVVFIKELSNRWLSLSYFHGGIRSGTRRDVRFEKVSVPAEEPSSAPTKRILPFARRR